MGFRGVDLEGERDDAPKEPAWPRREARAIRDALRDVSGRRLAVVVLYIAALVGAGAMLARLVSTEAGTALVVVSLLLLAALAFKSRNRRGDSGMDASTGIYAGGGEWMGGDGGGGGGGGGD